MLTLPRDSVDTPKFKILENTLVIMVSQCDTARNS